MDWVGFQLVVPRAMTVEESHDICDRIERAIRREIAGAMITIHVEPDPKRHDAPCIPIADGGGELKISNDDFVSAAERSTAVRWWPSAYRTTNLDEQSKRNTKNDQHYSLINCLTR